MNDKTPQIETMSSDDDINVIIAIIWEESVKQNSNSAYATGIKHGLETLVNQVNQFRKTVYS